MRLQTPGMGRSSCSFFGIGRSVAEVEMQSPYHTADGKNRHKEREGERERERNERGTRDRDSKRESIDDKQVAF